MATQNTQSSEIIPQETTVYFFEMNSISQNDEDTTYIIVPSNVPDVEISPPSGHLINFDEKNDVYWLGILTSIFFVGCQLVTYTGNDTFKKQIMCNPVYNSTFNQYVDISPNQSITGWFFVNSILFYLAYAVIFFVVIGGFFSESIKKLITKSFMYVWFRILLLLLVFILAWIINGFVLYENCSNMGSNISYSMGLGPDAIHQFMRKTLVINIIVTIYIIFVLKKSN